MLLPLTGISIAGAGLSLLFHVIGLAIPYWETTGGLFLSIDKGLWQKCALMSCSTIPWIEVSCALHATRAMVLIGMVALIGSLLCGILKLTAMKEMAVLTKIAGACAIAAGLFMIIGVMIYGIALKGPSMDFGSGFTMTTTAATGSFVAGVLFIIDKGQQLDISSFPFKLVPGTE